MADKAEIARALREIGALLELDGENPFKVRAYENGARALESLQERLSSSGVEQCPCAVAEADGAPRIVKVLARQQGCCCGHGLPAGEGRAAGDRSRRNGGRGTPQA